MLNRLTYTLYQDVLGTMAGKFLGHYEGGEGISRGQVRPCHWDLTWVQILTLPTASCMTRDGASFTVKWDLKLNLTSLLSSCTENRWQTHGNVLTLGTLCTRLTAVSIITLHNTHNGLLLGRGWVVRSHLRSVLAALSYLGKNIPLCVQVVF